MEQNLIIVVDNLLAEENSNAQQTIVHFHTSIHLFLLNNRKSNRDLKRKKSIYESLCNMIKWQLGCLKQEGFFKAPFYSNILPLEKHIPFESQIEVMQWWCCSYTRKNDTPTTVFFFTCNKMVAREIGRRQHLIKRKEPLQLK